MVQVVFPRRSCFNVGLRAVRAYSAFAPISIVAISLNADLNPRRQERHLTAGRDYGADRIVVLSKADFVSIKGAALALAPPLSGAPLIGVSSFKGVGS